MGGSLSPLFTPDNSGDKTPRKRNLLETIKGARKTRAPSTAPRELDKKQKTKNPYAYDDAPYQRFRLDGNGENSSSCNKGNRRRPEARIEHPWCKQVVRNKASAWESHPGTSLPRKANTGTTRQMRMVAAQAMPINANSLHDMGTPLPGNDHTRSNAGQGADKDSRTR